MPGYSGGTAAGDLARLRRMIDESGTATYSDAMLGSIIAYYPIPDITGQEPYLYSGSANTSWTATYDLAAAASDIWQEKAAALAANSYDFTADGATFHRSQMTQGAAGQATFWRSRRIARGRTLRTDLGTVYDDVLWIDNLAEPTDY